MKRKSGRKSTSKKDEDNSNGVEADNRSEQNGDTSEHEEDEAPKSKRKKAGKSGKKAAPATKKAEAASGDSEKSEDEDEYAAEVEHKKKKIGKTGKKTASKKDDDTLESEKSDDDSNEVEIKTPKGRKSKQDKEDPLAGLGETDIVEEAQKKKSKKAGKKTSQKEEQEQSDQNEDDDDNEQYEVEEIIDMKKVKGVVEYLIRWKGYGKESDTWEPADTLSCPELIKAYKEKHRGRPRKDKKKEVKVPDWDENEHFEVDRILEVHHKRDGSREFLVHWKGYSTSDSSWEPESNLDCKELIDKFMAKVENAKNVDEKELRVHRKQVQRYTLATTETGRRLSRRFANKERVQYHDAE